MQEAELLFRFPSATARAIALALAPETALDSPDVPKARATIAEHEGALSIRLEAEDISALRAALNSYLRWVDSAERATRVA